MIGFAVARVRAGKSMPGVVEIDRHAVISDVVEDSLILSGATEPGELEGLVTFVPLK